MHTNKHKFIRAGLAFFLVFLVFAPGCATQPEPKPRPPAVEYVP